MATQLFFLNVAADTHRGDRTLNLIGGAGAWYAYALGTARGGGLATQSTGTVAGPTAGLEISSGTPSEWLSPPLAAAVTISGAITGNLWSSENDMAANVAINFVVDKVAAINNAITQIVQSARITEVAITTRAVNNFTATPAAGVTLNKGDRLRVRVFGDDAGTMGASLTFDFAYAGTSAAADGDSYVSFTETFSFASAPSGTTIYPTDTVSAVATASVDREAWTSRGDGVQNDVTNTAAGATAGIQVTDTAGGTVVDWFTRQLAAFTLAGMAQVNVRVAESNIAANASIRVEIARVEADGTGPSVWGSWCVAPIVVSDFGEPTTTEAARTAWVSGDDLAVAAGERLRIRLYVDDNSAQLLVTGHTVTIYYAGTSGAASGDMYVTFAQTLTEGVAGVMRPEQFNPVPLIPRGRSM